MCRISAFGSEHTAACDKDRHATGMARSMQLMLNPNHFFLLLHTVRRAVIAYSRDKHQPADLHSQIANTYTSLSPIWIHYSHQCGIAASLLIATPTTRDHEAWPWRRLCDQWACLSARCLRQLRRTRRYLPDRAMSRLHAVDRERGAHLLACRCARRFGTSLELCRSWLAKRATGADHRLRTWCTRNSSRRLRHFSLLR